MCPILIITFYGKIRESKHPETTTKTNSIHFDKHQQLQENIKTINLGIGAIIKSTLKKTHAVD